MDTLTTEILQRVEQLPLEQKQAALEFVKSLENVENESPMPSSNGKPPFNREEWEVRILNTSVWSEEDIQEITNARKWMNEWQPPSF